MRACVGGAAAARIFSSSWRRLALTMARPLDAASFSLTPTEREEAVRVGRRSTVAADFGTEWRVAGEAPGQSLVVMTPFHRLALAARNSAFKSEELRPRDVESLAKDQEGRLVLWATVRGAKPDFARFYVPLLLPRRARDQAELRPERAHGAPGGGRHATRRGACTCFPPRSLDGKGRGHAGGAEFGERAGRAVQRRSLGHALAAGKELDHGHSGAVRAGHDLPAVPATRWAPTRRRS